jgi:hypothetical protein
LIASAIRQKHGKYATIMIAAATRLVTRPITSRLSKATTMIWPALSVMMIYSREERPGARPGSRGPVGPAACRSEADIPVNFDVLSPKRAIRRQASLYEAGRRVIG